jgi:hypothetical protein
MQFPWTCNIFACESSVVTIDEVIKQFVVYFNTKYTNFMTISIILTTMCSSLTFMFTFAC